MIRGRRPPELPGAPGLERQRVKEMADLNAIVDELSGLTIMEAAELAKLLEVALLSDSSLANEAWSLPGF